MQTLAVRGKQITGLINVVFFLVGAYALVSQTIILREFFVVVWGNEFVIGVLLASWLAGIFTGAWTGSGWVKKSAHLFSSFHAATLIPVMVLPLLITAIRQLYKISGTPPGVCINLFSALLYSGLFILPFSFFIGFLFPIAAAIQVTDSGDKKHHTLAVAKVYIYEAMGSLFAGVIYTFLLVDSMNSYFNAALFGLLLLTAMAWLCLKLKRKVLLALAGILLVGQLIFLYPPVNRYVDRHMVEARWKSISALPLIHSADSKFQNITVAKFYGQYNIYTNAKLWSIFPNDSDNRILAAHLCVQHPAPRSILVIGEAFTGLARQLFALGIEKVDCVEIDAELVRTVKRFLPKELKSLFTHPNFNVVIADGRKYIDKITTVNLRNPKHSRSFDMVYLNIPEPSTLLANRLFTRQFFQSLAKALRPSGVVALKLTSSENYTGGVVSRYTSSVYNTVTTVFPHCAVSPGPEIFIFASADRRSISGDPRILTQRYRRLRPKPDGLEEIFSSLYPEEKTRFITGFLERSRTTKINSDQKPIASLFYNRITGWYGGSNLEGIFDFFEKINRYHLLLVFVGLAILRLMALHFHSSSTTIRTTFHIQLAMISCGFAGISLELVILYLFQINFGYIYHSIGLIVAIFMFGLPMGALVTAREMRRCNNRNLNRKIHTVIAIQLGIALFALFLPQTSRIFFHIPWLNQIVLMACVSVTGFLVGAMFPAAVSIFIHHGKSPGKAAGLADAGDHLGAALGAFFTGALFIPVLGIHDVCFLICLMGVLSAVLVGSDIPIKGAQNSSR